MITNPRFCRYNEYNDNPLYVYMVNAIFAKISVVSSLQVALRVKWQKFDHDLYLAGILNE